MVIVSFVHQESFPVKVPQHVKHVLGVHIPLPPVALPRAFHVSKVNIVDQESAPVLSVQLERFLPMVRPAVVCALLDSTQTVSSHVALVLLVNIVELVLCPVRIAVLANFLVHMLLLAHLVHRANTSVHEDQRLAATVPLANIRI
jgi:hypothetical protein